MKILLTGSEGFIGSHVRDKLIKRGHSVYGVDNMESRVHGDTVVPSHSRTYLGDYGSVPYSLFMDMDVVVHLAAQVSVADSVFNPLRYVEHNTRQTAGFLGTLHMAIENGHKPQRFVIASSSSVYGNIMSPFFEVDACIPCNPYGITKYDQERLVLMYTDMWDIDAVALRYFNVYGPGQALHNPYTGVLANFARILMEGEAPWVTEDGQQVRDFVYIDDVADATVYAVENPLPEDVYNVCTGQPTMLIKAVEKLRDALGADVEIIPSGEHRDGDQRNVLGSCDLLRYDYKEWYPRSFDVGVREYAERLAATG